MKPDLTLLYSELGLQPNCSLAELQLAYRRRISQLRSNRTAGSQLTAESADALRQLIGLYTTASRFHRRYGRLPGAPPSRAGLPLRATYSATPRIGYLSSSADRPATASRTTLAVTVGLLVLLFALLAIVSGEWLR